MRNLTMMTDLYQLTMMYGYYKQSKQDEVAVFDVFFRENGESNYAVCCGLEQIIDYIKNLKFTKEDIDYIKSLHLFDEKFLAMLKDFHFSGDIYSVREGQVVFAQEPILIVKAKVFEAQLVETTILNILNHQTLIATKASRIVYAAGGSGVMEFGLRRAQGPDAGIYGARAAMIGGCDATSNVLAGKLFSVPVAGTHSHSWVMSFDNELQAFYAYAKCYPDECMLLVDTYDTLKSGVPNAIEVFRALKAQGHSPKGIRLDSGDLAYLSKRARTMLNDAGLNEVKICASGDLDEYLIESLKAQGAMIDSWGVGTRLITSQSMPSLGGVYKMAAIYQNGHCIPKIKRSDNSAKITTPGFKSLYRIYKADQMALADLVTLNEEQIDESKPLTIFHPQDTWKRLTITDFTVKPLLHKIFENGMLVYQLPALAEIRAFAKQDLATFWGEYRRVERPHIYKVDLSEQLFYLKQKLLSEN